MSPAIHYMANEEGDTVYRDKYHIKNNGFVVAFDIGDGVTNKVKIPRERIVRIDE